METVLNILLIRFAVIAGVLVILGLGVFAVAVALRRRGKLDRARDGAAQLARSTVRMLDERDRSLGLGGRDRRGGLGSTLAREVARHLGDGRSLGADRSRRDDQ